MNWNKNKFKDNTGRNSCCWAASAWSGLRQLQVVQYTCWGISLAPLSQPGLQLLLLPAWCSQSYEVFRVPWCKSHPYPWSCSHWAWTQDRALLKQFFYTTPPVASPNSDWVTMLWFLFCSKETFPYSTVWQLRDRAGPNAERDWCLNRAKRACSDGTYQPKSTEEATTWDSGKGK